MANTSYDHDHGGRQWLWVDCPTSPLDGCVGFVDDLSIRGPGISMCFPLSGDGLIGQDGAGFASAVMVCECFLRDGPVSPPSYVKKTPACPGWAEAAMDNTDFGAWLARLFGPRSLNRWYRSDVALDLPSGGYLQTYSRREGARREGLGV